MNCLKAIRHPLSLINDLIDEKMDKYHISFDEAKTLVVAELLFQNLNKNSFKGDVESLLELEPKTPVLLAVNTKNTSSKSNYKLLLNHNGALLCLNVFFDEMLGVDPEVKKLYKNCIKSEDFVAHTVGYSHRLVIGDELLGLSSLVLKKLDLKHNLNLNHNYDDYSLNQDSVTII